MNEDGGNQRALQNQSELPDSLFLSWRTLDVAPPFDLARTAAPAWWARGRWPNVDWQGGMLTWVGWESGRAVYRTVRQARPNSLDVAGSGSAAGDRQWAERVLGIDSHMPAFGVAMLEELAVEHRGMKPWAAGSLYEGVVSSVVGQSISVAAAATTERRLYAQFNDAITLGGRSFWPAPRPEHLAVADVNLVRSSGVTTKRAQALIEVGRAFSTGALRDAEDERFDRLMTSAQLLAISGIGPWTVRSAFLWGLGDPDAHPTGDVALLRAARRRLPHITTLRELDAAADDWAPYRGWAARLLWLDLLGYDNATSGDISHEPQA